MRLMGYILDRKLAAPVSCLTCKWSGRTGELMSRGSDVSGRLRCPRCDSDDIKWIENEPPQGLQ